jgi:hypothetical protein
MNMVICDFCRKEIEDHEDKKTITLEIKEPCSIIPIVKKLDFHSKCADVLKNKFDNLLKEMTEDGAE